MQYVRSLENRVKQLEDDKRSLTHKINQIATSSGDATIAIPPEAGVGVLSGRPEAVVRALQVLEVREQLEREGRLPERGETIAQVTNGDMDDGEKALVREMCNVSIQNFRIMMRKSRNNDTSINFFMQIKRYKSLTLIFIVAVKANYTISVFFF